MRLLGRCNGSAIHEEGTQSRDLVLSSAHNVSGGKSLYLDGKFTLESWISPQKWVTDHYGGATFTVFSRWLHGVRTLHLVNIDKIDDNTGKLTFYTDFAGRAALESKTSVPLNQPS